MTREKHTCVVGPDGSFDLTGIRGESVRLASDAYFFQEGTAEEYNGARFGEIRVNAKGHAVLTGLRDTEGNQLGDLVITKTSLIWCPGKTTPQKGIRVTWKRFIHLMDAEG